MHKLTQPLIIIIIIIIIINYLVGGTVIRA
jgi:hypothetical protein